METQIQELSIIEKSLEEFKSAGEVLKANQTRAAKAVEVGKRILADLEAAGGVMTADMDKRMQNHIVNCNQAKADMNEARKVYTQITTLITKAFTSEENKLDVTNKETPAYQMQQIRNSYAEQIHREEQERQRQIEAQRQKEQEAINIKAEGKKRLVAYFGAHMQERKMHMNSAFNQLTLDTFEDRSGALKGMQPAYTYQHFQAFTPNISGRYHNADELSAMLRTVIEPEFDGLAVQYKAELMELRDFLIDRLPSKKSELEAIRAQEEEMERQHQEQERLQKEQETASVERQKQIQAEQEEAAKRQQELEAERQRNLAAQQEREETERKRLEEVDRLRQQQQQQEIDQQKSVEETMNLFGSEVEIAEGKDGAHTPETRAGYEITIHGPAGWLLIVQQWFTECGLQLSEEKIASTKLETMRTFCEKLANKEEGKKIKSNLIQYKETFKAVNRKAK